MKMTKNQRIKVAIKLAFAGGIIVGVIVGGLIGNAIGSGKLKIELPKQEQPCYAVQCDCIERDAYGRVKPYKDKNYHCGLHGHNCEYGE